MTQGRDTGSSEDGGDADALGRSIMGNLLRGQVLVLVANALQLADSEAAIVEQFIKKVVASPGQQEWPAGRAYWAACGRILALTRQAYPTIESSPLGATWKGKVPGHTQEVVIGELAPEIRAAYTEAIKGLRDSDDKEFGRIANAGRAAEQQFGRKSAVARFLRGCGHLAFTVQQTRADWA